MSLEIVGSIALKLGPVIAKALLKRYLNDGPKHDLASGLIDLAKEQGEKLSGRTQSTAMIEAVADKIVDQVWVVFRYEGPTLDDQARMAVVYEVATTLRNVQITGQTLANINMNPHLLATKLIDSRPEVLRNFFSEVAAEAYRMVLRELSRAIVQTASQVSGFAEALWSKSLSSEAEMLQILRLLLAQASKEDIEFEQRYLQRVAEHLDRVELFGLWEVDELSQQQSLSVAYVTLQVEGGQGRSTRIRTSTATLGNAQEAPLGEKVLEFQSVAPGSMAAAESRVTNPGNLWGKGQMGRSKGTISPVFTQFGPVDEMVNTSLRVVIQGDAGSGKSTLLQWIAVRLAVKDIEQEAPHLISWVGLIPFFVRLREHADGSFPAPEELIGAPGRNIKGSMPKGWVERQLEEGRAVVLIDGVDELPQQQRKDMLKQLQQFVIDYPEARYIITSRPPALNEWPEWEAWTASKEFVQARLLPMNPEQVTQSIKQWHKALAIAARDEEERQHIQDLAEHLLALLRGRRPLRLLAASPLLCSMICALHRRMPESLPSERIELYRKCIEMLVSTREVERKIKVSDEYARVTVRQAYSLIKPLAFWMMDNGYTDVEKAEVDERFAEILPALSLDPSITPVQVRNFFVYRSNLLREPVEGRIDFTHRTFQEFLAAQYAIEKNNLGVLVRNSIDDTWRETIILAAGSGRPEESEKLLRMLIERGNISPENRQQLHLLAVACLETCSELEPQVRRLVLDHVAPLVPPRNDDDAKILSAGGDPIAPLLHWNVETESWAAALCIRTLAMIGTDAAMKAIATYVPDNRVEVKRAIGQAWDGFDRKEYARKVLDSCSHLHLTSQLGNEEAELLSHIVSLSIDATGKHYNFSPITKLRSLKILTLYWRAEQDIAMLASMSDLVSFRIVATSWYDMVQVASLYNLTELELEGGTVEDLEPLSRLHNLAFLDLASTWVQDLAPLANLANLVSLRLAGTPVHDIRPLVMLKNLASLDLAGTEVQDLTPLVPLQSLATLNLSGTMVEDLVLLASLQSLTTLDLSGTTVNDLEPLTGLKNLTTLDLGRTGVQDLAPLANLTSLVSLRLAGTPVHDIRPLAMLKNLAFLDLAGTEVQDLTPLTSLHSLTTLDLSGTTVNDLEPLTGLMNLTTLDISATTIHDLSKLLGLGKLQNLYLSHSQRQYTTQLSGHPSVQIEIG
ncbi:MAG: leucine-rich repeat domain-containing protein [Chloroflexota bacterium]|nr:leucine-rich repeat domain-containing protein [Chloroflexota bacterium]